MASKSDGPEWVPMYLVTLLLVAFLLVIGAAGHEAEPPVRTPQAPLIEPPSPDLGFGGLAGRSEAPASPAPAYLSFQ
ncbi:hypothetical protein [Marmoricola sp. RAF53]|uniref:hypothetical protein n=1 Tax=Marmoricola sp. RAF53 TaxID=3233059 RepID=UPI003F9E2C2F